MMGWIYLLWTSGFEIIFTVLLKYSEGYSKLLPSTIATVFPMSAFPIGSVRCFALGSGWLVHPSVRAQSGLVLIASFSSLSGAGQFACRWSGRLSRSVLVRRVAAGWAVSVPVVA
jgi:hypothetical protein